MSFTIGWSWLIDFMHSLLFYMEIILPCLFFVWISKKNKLFFHNGEKVFGQLFAGKRVLILIKNK